MQICIVNKDYLDTLLMYPIAEKFSISQLSQNGTRQVIVVRIDKVVLKIRVINYHNFILSKHKLEDMNDNVLKLHHFNRNTLRC